MSQTWVQKANLPGTQRLTPVAFSIGSKGYLGVGSIGFSSSVADFWEYDPATNAWTQKANFAGGPRGFACGFSIGSKGYIGTGLNNTTYFNDFWQYDPVANSWSQKASVGTILRWASVAFEVNGKGYIGMGHDSDYIAQQDLYEYDPAVNTWTQKANYTGPRGDVDRACFVIGSKAYCGTGANIGTFVDYNDFWEYDPAINSWTQKSNYPGVKRHGATGFSICNFGYLGLGQDLAVNSFGDFWKYDPAANVWSAFTTFGGNARGDAASFVIGNKAYVSCGSSGSSPFVMYKDLWEFGAAGTLTVTASTAVICSGTAVTLNVSGGSSYIWNTGSTSNSIVVSPTTSTTYSVTDPGNACSSAGTILVSVISQPPVTIGGSASVCSGSSAVLTASGGGNYSWTTGATTVSIVVAPTVSTTYSVIASAATCADTGAFTVSVIQPPVANIVCADSVCPGQAAALSASGGAAYNWSTGATTAAINIFPTASSSFTVVVSSGGCSDTASCSVVVNPSVIANAGPDISIAFGDTASLVASGGGAYSWSTGDTTAAISVVPLVSTSYCVFVSNPPLCPDTDCVFIFVDANDCSAASTGELFFPGAFSPNGDNENETFGLYFGKYECIDTYLLVIYNRWGEKVFESSDSKAVWDGKFGGNYENTAVFVWYLKATLNSGTEIERKGNVSLMK